MVDSILKFKRTQATDKKFSILIPTWNNLDYLQLCLKSLESNSHFNHQFIVIVNEGTDGTLDWIKKQENIDYVYTPKNIGICYALNACRSLIDTDYVVYANDDMYFLPNWDKPLFDEIQKINHKRFMFSATMIEPSSKNACAVIKNFGTDIKSFCETELLLQQSSLERADWSGSTWPPNVVHIDCWDLIGGMSIEFSPGMYSDPDLARKLWEIGVRIFIGKGNSLVYHFGCKSTARIKRNQGQKTFVLKWGVSARTFMEFYLHRGKDAREKLPENNLSKLNLLNQILKKIKASF